MQTIGPLDSYYILMRADELFRQISRKPPFTKLHPRLAEFFRDYFRGEKAVIFQDRYVVNTNFPPYPSRAFDRLVEQFSRVGNAKERSLYSVTLAVTNRCAYDCWHCYNTGRSQVDIPLAALKTLVGDLQRLGAAMVTLTGGEPLLRDDLEEIVRTFDDRSCLMLGTTGAGLTAARAHNLRDRGLFAVGISLDSEREEEHDRLRGRRGAFQFALEALHTAREAGLYPYVVSVATREFLERSRFFSFLRFAADAGALEVHLLEPSATGKLAGQSDVLLSAAERRQIINYQHEVARDDSLPILSSFSYVESSSAFGCGAGLTHLYVDGSGEVCPCNLVPLSFGNVLRAPVDSILGRMGQHFTKPRPGCVGRILAKHIPPGTAPASPELSFEVCRRHLPPVHALPTFFRIREEAFEEVGPAELRAAYDGVRENYDMFWLTEAARPIHNLVETLHWSGDETVFEAGCGTGYATALLAGRAARVIAVDLSPGMVEEARKRLHRLGVVNVELQVGDALDCLKERDSLDLVFSSWVLGYIPVQPFLHTACSALKTGGRIAFVVHKENSPREPLEIFAELTSEDPSILLKRVAFDFPRDQEHIRSQIQESGLEMSQLWEGVAVFQYPTAEAVLEHLLKSGAGTAFYEAIDPARRKSLTDRFLKMLIDRQSTPYGYQVCHDYLACVARKP